MAEGSILIVDDEYGVRSGIRTILEMEGYEVAEAGDGAAALAALDERDFDVALLDYRLPDTDGLSLLQTMKQRGCEAMVCMITAYANIDTAIAATRQGVDFFLPKPFSPTTSRASSRRCCATSRRAPRRSACAPSTRRACSPWPRRRRRRTRWSARCATPCSWSTGTATWCSPTRRCSSCSELSEDEVLMRPAQELLGGGALAPLCEQLAAPAKDRTVAPARASASRRYMASIVTFRDEDGEALRPHPHAQRHQRGAAPRHGEAEVHPHDGARAQEPARARSRACSRWSPTRASATTSSRTCR